MIASLPDIVLPDGVTALDYDRGVVLVADAYKGIIWRVDTTTGAYSVAIKDPRFRRTNPDIPLGVDGIHILNNELYFTNFAANLVGKIPITADGSAASSVQNFTSKALFPDDFCLAEGGTAYVAGYNTLWRVSPDGDTIPLVGGPNSTVVQGVTSAQFGRTRDDQGVVYMGTEGGIFFTPPGAEVHGGQLLAVNVGLFE